MIIQKMNNVLVKHGKITFAIFTFVIIVSFVWFFTPGVDGSLLFGGASVGVGSKYGEVLGHDVTFGDLGEARQIVSMVRAATYGLPPNRVSSPDEDASAQYAFLIKAAEVLNIQVSDKEVGEMIRSMPAFQAEDGKFSEKLYAEYHDKCLAPLGLDYSNLEEAIRVLLKMEKVPTLTTSNVILTEGELEAGIESLLGKITYRLITFDPEAFADSVKVEDLEVREFYDAHKDLFMSEPESDGLIAFAAYTVKVDETITEEQVKEYYEAHKDSYVKLDGTEVPFDEVKDAIRAEIGTTVEREPAVEKMQAFHKAFRARVKEDKDAYYADPQKVFREEAEKAGLKVTEIKQITARTQDDAEFHINAALVEAVTILQNVGSDTNIIQSEGGVSKFLLTARRPSVLQPFDDVKETAQKRVVSQKEHALAEEAAAQLGVKFAELKDATPARIEEIVKSLNGVWHDEITRSRIEIEGNPYMPAVNEILTTEPGMLSAPDKQYGFPVLVYVSAHTAATAEEIDESRSVLERELKFRKQSIVSRGIQDWVGGSIRIIDRGQNRN